MKKIEIELNELKLRRAIKSRVIEQQQKNLLMSGRVDQHTNTTEVH